MVVSDKKVYRNIYFLNNMFKLGNGTIDIHYSGNIYSNAKLIKTFNKVFDPKQDLLISCADCASKKYRKFIKTNNNLKTCQKQIKKLK